MKNMQRILYVLCLVLFICTGTVKAQYMTSYKTPPLSLQLNGKKVGSTYSPIIKNNVLLVPVRTVGEGLGYKITWDSNKKIMQLSMGKDKITLTHGKSEAIVNGRKTKLETQAQLNNSKLYVPLSFFQKNISCSATYDKAKKIVCISKKTVQAPNTLNTQVKSSKSIYVLGKNINCAPLQKNNITYIPLRAVAEQLGFTVNWNASTNTMDFKNEMFGARVIIGKTDGYIENTKITLDAPPILYGGRAYVPMSFISKHFEYDINFDNKNITVSIEKKKEMPKQEINEKALVQDILYKDDGGFAQLSIVADKPVTYTSFALSNPERLVIDIPNSTMSTDFEQKEINQGSVSRVRIGQFSVSPDVVRIVVDLTNQKACKLVQSDDKKTIDLIYANIVKQVVHENLNGKEIFSVESSGLMDCSVTLIDNPKRLVVDVKRAVFENKDQLIELKDNPLIKQVRTGQFDVGTARIVFELMDGAYYDVKTVDSITKISLSDIPFSIIDYEKGYDNALVNINVEDNQKSRVIYDENEKIITVISPIDIEVEDKMFEINDNLIEYYMTEKTKTDGQVNTITKLKLKDSVVYKMEDVKDKRLVKLKIEKKISKPQDITIIVDAGHGGKDPGAVAKDSTTEKQLNLDVAKRLNTELTKLGFNTIMTRTDDTYVDLATRANTANDNYADFFLSIHFNAFMNSAKGIETLYYPNTPTDLYSIDNKNTAKIFHEEVIKELNRTSRGITPRPNLYVLNKTKMPAILCELGFMTNSEEFSQIKKEEYRQKAAKALSTSIVRYFKEMKGIELEFESAANNEEIDIAQNN